MGGCRILIVDGDASSRAAAERALALDGHSVLSAACGADATALLDQGSMPDLVIATEKADGAALLRAIRSRSQGIPVVLVSGSSSAAALDAVQGVALEAPAPTPEPTAATPAPRRTPLPARPTLAEVERRYAAEILRETGGNKSRAAQILGIDRKTLYRILEGRAPDASGS